MQAGSEDIAFERVGPVARILRTVLVNPFANYAPAGMIRWLLRATRSEVAAANWADPGGWRSMVISYEGRCRQWADKVLVGWGAVPMALRNRRRLAARVLAGLIDACSHSPPEVLCVGAGPGMIIFDALSQARSPARATLVDLSYDAHDYARQRARQHGLDDRVRFVTGDVRQIAKHLDGRVDIVKMIGICEYLPDEQIVSMAQTLATVMPPGGTVVFNSLSGRHGTDRFFRRVFGLHMIHRPVEALSELMRQAGFGEFQSRGEPLGVYHVVTARKPS
ncbi:MAG: class I SAM-dependent methyltransferase [Phycisphaerae bacterium]|nr:class I SAM-dependent methyltransferase [Phycisphaerae bacterium]